MNSNSQVIFLPSLIKYNNNIRKLWTWEGKKGLINFYMQIIFILRYICNRVDKVKHPFKKFYIPWLRSSAIHHGV